MKKLSRQDYDEYAQMCVAILGITFVIGLLGEMGTTSVSFNNNVSHPFMWAHVFIIGAWPLGVFLLGAAIFLLCRPKI